MQATVPQDRFWINENGVHASPSHQIIAITHGCWNCTHTTNTLGLYKICTLENHNANSTVSLLQWMFHQVIWHSILYIYIYLYMYLFSAKSPIFMTKSMKNTVSSMLCHSILVSSLSLKTLRNPHASTSKHCTIHCFTTCCPLLYTLQWNIRTPSTGLWHPSSNHCHNWLRHHSSNHCHDWLHPSFLQPLPSLVTASFLQPLPSLVMS